MKKVEKIYCIACKSNKIKKLYPLLQYDNYLLMECMECNLKFLLSKDFKTLDDDEYWDEVNKKIYTMPDVLKEFKKKHYKYLKIIKEYRPPNNKLLDVGCGNGIFLAHAREKGFKVTGIEPSKIAISLCEKQYGIKPIWGYLKFNSNIPKDFGVLTIWDVIEHVSDPREFLKICHLHLEQNGILLLETPDESCLIRKIIKALNLKMQRYIYYPAHRYYFTHKAIKILLSDLGFSNIKIYKEHSIFSKSKMKYKLYRNYSKIHMMKYDLFFLILKIPLFWNKQVVICTKR